MSLFVHPSLSLSVALFFFFFFASHSLSPSVGKESTRGFAARARRRSSLSRSSARLLSLASNSCPTVHILTATSCPARTRGARPQASIDVMNETSVVPINSECVTTANTPAGITNAPHSAFVQAILALNTQLWPRQFSLSITQLSRNGATHAARRRQPRFRARFVSKVDRFVPRE